MGNNYFVKKKKKRIETALLSYMAVTTTVAVSNECYLLCGVLFKHFLIFYGN